jgi:hypothetical protein
LKITNLDLMNRSRSALRPSAGLFLWIGIVACLLAPPVSAQSEAPSPSAQQAEDNQRVGYLLADKVYRKPDAFADEVTSVTRNDRVRVAPLADRDGWYEVFLVGEPERVGYAFRPYVSRFGPQGLASEPVAGTRDTEGSEPLFEVVFAPTPTSVGATRVVRTWANVRTGPGMNHEAFGVIRPGTPFQVLAVERGWGRISLDGEPGVGYVSASLLHTPTPSEMNIAESAESDRQSVVGGGQAGGGVADDMETVEEVEPEVSQGEMIRNALMGSGVNPDATVYVTRTGQKFHREGCRHLRSRTFAIPLAEAMLDYSPCRTCKPLQPEDDQPDQPGQAPEQPNAPVPGN